MKKTERVMKLVELTLRVIWHAIRLLHAMKELI